MTVTILGRNVDFAALTTPNIVTNEVVVTNAAANPFLNTANVPPPSPRPRFNAANTVVIPLCIAATFGGGLYMKFHSQAAYDDYIERLDAYNISQSSADYQSLTNAGQLLKDDFTIQTVFYSASGILTAIELYMLFAKPHTSVSFQWIALPNYIGISYGF